MTADPDIIEQCIGAMGRYHWIITIGIFLSKFPIAWHLTSHGIMVPASTPIYCVNTTMPVDATLTQDERKDMMKEACAAACPEIIVSKKYYTNSILNQYKLYCGRAYLASLAQLLVMTGVFIGCSLFGVIADKWGRKNALLASCLGQPILGTIVALSPNVYCFLIFKFLLNIFVGGCMVVGYVLFCEFAGANWRPRLGILYHFPFALGQLSLSGFAYLIRDWRYFQLAISLPALLCVLYVFIPESPRWLLTTNKTEQAIKVLEYTAKKNNLPTENIETLVVEYQNKRAREIADIAKGNMKYLFSTKPMVVITLGMWYNWLAVAMCFYGITQYSGGLGGNLYLDFAMAALLQFPGVFAALFAIPHIGRKWSLFIGNSIACVALFVTIFMLRKVHFLIIPVSITMFGLAMSFVGLYVYSCELFPTVIRNIGIGTSSSLGRIGGMAAAAITDIKEYPIVPPLVYCVIIALAAGLCLILPETKGKQLPDTVEDAGNLRKRN